MRQTVEQRRAVTNACTKRWRAANPEKVRANEIRFRERHRERLNDVAKEYHRTTGRYKRLGIDPATVSPEPNTCEICGGHSTGAFHLDHDHKTGKFRGWLCSLCNSGIGHFKDNPILFEKAAAYLRSHHGS